MPNIHPSSIVDPQVQLADDVTIGPWCLIQGDVTIGQGCVIMERVTLRGPLTIGSYNTIYPNCCIGLEPQDKKYDPKFAGSGVLIGDHNILREAVTIHRATRDIPTTLGNQNMLMAESHMAHDCIVGNQVIMANSTLLAGHTVVSNQVVMSGHTGAHQFCRIGRLAMISGNLVAFEDVPPFCTMFLHRSVNELNLVGLRRAGLRDHIDSLKKAFDIYYRHQHTRPVALKIIDDTLLDDPLCREFADFLRTPSKRGITKYKSGKARERNRE